MTQHSDLLLTLAQIFIAFAGFAGVVAAFSHFRLAPEATAYRVRLMVAVALLMLLGSLLPLVFEATGMSAEGVTRLSASFLASGGIAIGLWAWQRLRPLYRAGLLNTQLITTVWYATTAMLVLGLFGVGAGFSQALAPAMYLGALFFGIVLCSYYFFMLMLAIELGKRD
jgi:hypothetical protein